MDNSTNAVTCDIEKQTYSALAVAKLAKELEEFTGGNKEKAVSKFVASTLTHFCEEQERFAEAVYRTPRTLSDCCAEVMAGCGNQISDIDVYRGAVKSYFPNADVSFKMESQITGEQPTEEELMRKPEKKVHKPKKESKPKPETQKFLAAVRPEPAAKPAAKPKIESFQLSLF